MKLDRRNFIKKIGVSASLPFVYTQLLGCDSSKAENEKIITEEGIFENYGIQLWTVKEDMAKDPKATLKALAEYGYKQIESFEGDKGIFWGMTPAEFKTLTQDLGLTMVSSHCNPMFTTDISTTDEFKTLAEGAAVVGLKYLINPFPGPITTKDEWQKVAEGLNRQGEICKQFGLKAAYHNHHFEFIKLADGTIPEKLLLDNTEKDLVDFELDLYWVVKAGQDPMKWLSDYEGRFKLCHVKDLHKKERIDEILSTEKQEDPFWPVGTSCKLGDGQIDFANLLKYAKTKGMEYYITEQERYDNSTAMDDAKSNALYMDAFVKV